MSRPSARMPLLALCVVVSIVLAACGASQSQPSTTGTPAAAPTQASAGQSDSPKDALVYAGDFSDLITFDPAVVYEFSGIQVVGNIYETLVSFDPGDPVLKPVLAKTWDVKDAGSTWVLTFNLDERATFASGRPVTADDVIYSWGRALDLNKPPSFLFTEVAKLTKEGMRAVDAHTIEVTLPKTASPQVFLSILSFSVAAVVDKQEVEKNLGTDMGSTWLNDHSAGSGPYVLERWERSAQVTLATNPNFWRTAPAIKRVIMRTMTEQANLQAAIEAGDADIAQDIGSEQAKQLENSPDAQIVRVNSTILVYLGMNVSVPPLDKPDVREAIRYALNYDEIVNNVLSGNAALSQEMIPIGFFGATGEKPFQQDIAKAKALLASAGVAEGTEIEFLVPATTIPGGVEASILAAKIQNDVQQIGLKLNIKQVQMSELLNIYRAQKGQLVLSYWAPDFPDPDGNATPFTNFDAQSVAWRNAWNAPDIAALGQQAALEPDTTKRAALYKQLTERVFHEGPYAILYQPKITFAIRKNIMGFAGDPNDTPSVSFWLLSKR